MKLDKSVESDMDTLLEFEEKVFNKNNKYWLEILSIFDLNKETLDRVISKLNKNTLGLCVFNKKNSNDKIILLFKDSADDIKLAGLGGLKYSVLDISHVSDPLINDNYYISDIASRNVARINLVGYYTGSFTLYS